MINGPRMEPSRIDEGVTGGYEIWEVRSIDAFTHNFHIHDVQYQVLDIDGEMPRQSSLVEGHGLPRAAESLSARHELRGLHRPRQSLHVPLPPAPPPG
jgi:FtsP/CotA-like multicopper oxidase with cupredoxin domain